MLWMAVASVIDEYLQTDDLSRRWHRYGYLISIKEEPIRNQLKKTFWCLVGSHYYV